MDDCRAGSCGFLLAVCICLADLECSAAQPLAGPGQTGSQTNSRVIDFGTALDPQAQMRESQQLAKSLAQTNSPQWQAKGDQRRTYRLPDTGENMPYRVCVPTNWDGSTKLPLVMF